MGFWDEFRRGRDDIRAAQGAPPVGGKGRDESRNNDWRGNGGWQDEQPHRPGAHSIAGLEAALRERDDNLEEALRVVVELKKYAEQLQEQMAQLTAGVEPMAKVLMLPGVKTFLLQRFHPDKYPDADEEQRRLITEAMQAITVAYAAVAKGFHNAS